MRRRVFLSGAIALGVPRSGATAGATVVREDVACLPADRLARLDGAIGAMQRLSATNPDDPAGWRAHARGHAQVCSAVANGDPDQVHGSWWFLPWHRAFLAVTEWKLRALSGDPTLALPYWNWSSDRRIPDAFSRPGTALANAVRHTPARPLSPAEVDHLGFDPALARLGVAALGARAFIAHTPEQIATAFGGVAKPNLGGWHGRSRLETVPHGAIHNYAGGEAADGSLGDMTELSTAALDPLFYAHHANLDRLWERWRQDPARRATEPTDPALTGQAFYFPWLDGSLVAITVAELLRPAAGYDTLAVFRNAPPAATSGDRLPPLASETLRCPETSGRCALRIEGVMPTDRPVSVAFSLARPGEPGSAIDIGAFAIGRRHSRPEYPDTEVRFDVTAALRQLRGREVVVRVTPLPLGPAERPPPAFVHAGMDIVQTG